MGDSSIPAILRPAQYGTAWMREREAFLRCYPTCVYCEKYKNGRITAATVVDHITPHRGNPALFWDRSNWQALCQSCHDRHKQREEKVNRAIGCAADGTPFDPQHHWRVGSTRGR